jgi:hypothetical protein
LKGTRQVERYFAAVLSTRVLFSSRRVFALLISVQARRLKYGAGARDLHCLRFCILFHSIDNRRYPFFGHPLLENLDRNLDRLLSLTIVETPARKLVRFFVIAL